MLLGFIKYFRKEILAVYEACRDSSGFADGSEHQSYVFCVVNPAIGKMSVHKEDSHGTIR